MGIGIQLYLAGLLLSNTVSFSHCFSNAEADTVDDWLRSFAFAWGRLI